MFYYLKFAFKNIFSRKSSIVIVLFVTFIVTTLITVNAIFDGTEHGIERVYKSSFTGDIVIRERTKENVSLFGNVSIVDESILPIEEVSNYPKLMKYVKDLNEVETTTEQISCYAAIEWNEMRYNSAVFGVNAEEYTNIMDSIDILEGKPFGENEKGCILSKIWVDKFCLESGKCLQVGDEIQLVYTDGQTFRIRALPVKAIYSYPVENAVLNRIVLIDQNTARSLFGKKYLYDYDKQEKTENPGMNIADAPAKQEYMDINEDDLDSMFDTASDFEVEESKSKEFNFKTDKTAENLSDEKPINWDFVILKLKDGVNEHITIKKINTYAKANGFNFEAISWRTAAGPTAQYIFWLRMILIFGIFIILFSGLIVVNNTLVINIIDRTREIGTMRAIGAKKTNISFQCIRETLIICIISFAASCILSTLIVLIMIIAPVHLHNPFFMELFGGDFLLPKFSLDNYLQGLGLSLFVGLCSWIVPVIEALKIMPVVAMKGGKL